VPVQIGANAHSFTEPTGLLSDCHRRDEMFLGTLEVVAQTIDNLPARSVRAEFLARCVRRNDTAGGHEGVHNCTDSLLRRR
jgi:hypothetical protein